MKLAIVLVTGCATDLVIHNGAFVRDAPARFTAAPEHVDPNQTAEKRSADTDTGRTVGWQGGETVVFANHFLTGIDLELGHTSSTAAGTMTTDDSGYFGVSWLAGVTGRAGRLGATADLAASVHRFDRVELDRELEYVHDEWTVEARLRVDVWLSRYLTLGVMAGSDLTGANRFGIVLGAHPGVAHSRSR